MSIDDWTISCLLSAEYQVKAPCLFINSVLSYIILALQNAFPIFNWLYIIERFMVFLALVILSYIGIYYISKGRIFPIFLFLLFLSGFVLPGCLLDGNFTFIAALASFSGSIGFLFLLFNQDQATRSKPWFLIILCAICFIFGFILRVESALLMMPFFILSVVFSFFGKRPAFNRKSWLVFSSTTSKVLILAIGITLIFSGINYYSWEKDDLRAWDDYNHARSRLSDYPVPSYTEIQDRLNKIGVSENDYWLVTNWTSDASDIFTTELLNNIADICDEYKQESAPVSLFAKLKSYIFHILGNQILLILVLISLFSNLFSRTCIKTKLGCFVLFGMALVCCGYFFFNGRLPERVEHPIWMAYIGFSVLLILNYHDSRGNQVLARIVPVFPIMLAIVCVFIGIAFCDKGNLMQNENTKTDSKVEILRYLEESAKDGKVFFWDTGSMNLYAELFQLHDIPSEEIGGANFKLGGWTTCSPQTNAAKAEVFCGENQGGGLASILFNAEAYYVCTSSSDIGNRIEVFLKEHYYADIEKKLVQVVNSNSNENVSIEVWKFVETTE